MGDGGAVNVQFTWSVLIPYIYIQNKELKVNIADAILVNGFNRMLNYSFVL